MRCVVRAAFVFAGLWGCDASDPDPADGFPQDVYAVTEPANPLDDARYGFCHRAGVDGFQLESWCPLVEQLDDDVCPGAHTTCRDALFAAPAGGCVGEPGDPTNAPLEPPDWGRRLAELPVCGGGLGLAAFDALLRWGLALGIALLLVALAKQIFGVLGRVREEAHEAPVAGAVETGDLGLRDVADGDVPVVDRTLARAEQLLDEGAYGDAVDVARAVALDALEAHGRVRTDRSQTDREVAWTLRPHVALAEGWSRILTGVERHRWAGRELTEDVARGALAGARAILRVVAATVWLGCLWAASDSEAWAGRHSPVGDSALIDLLRHGGYRVDHLSALEDVDDSWDAVFLDLSGVVPVDEDWEALIRWVEEGGILVLAGSPGIWVPELGHAEPTPFDVAEVRWSVAVPEDVVEPLPWLGPVYPGGPTEVWRRLDGAAREGDEEQVDDTGIGEGSFDAQVARSHDLWAAFPDAAEGRDTGRAVVRVVRRGRGVFVGVSDPRLFWNAAQLAPVNREFLVRLLPRGAEADLWALASKPRIAVAAMSSVASQSPLRTLRNTEMLPFVLAVLAWWALVVRWRGAAFSPLRPVDRAVRARFGEHVDALADHYAQVGDTRFAASAYARLWTQRLGHRGLVRAARSQGLKWDDADRFATRVESLARTPMGPVEGDERRLVEALWKWTR